MEFSKKIWVGYLEYEPDSIASMGGLSLPKLWMWSAELTWKGEIKQLRMEATEGEKMEEWGGVMQCCSISYSCSQSRVEEKQEKQAWVWLKREGDLLQS